MTQTNRPKPLLDPISRISEIVFGLIMALTFTGSLSAATAAREDVHTMFLGAVGCNIAWGLVDAVMFLVTRITEQGRNLHTLRAVRAETDADKARAVIADELPAPVAQILSPDELESFRKRLAQLPEPPAQPRLKMADFLGALAVFLWVVVSTFPVTLPFIVVHHVGVAMRISNGIAILMLFGCGYGLGRYCKFRPWGMGLGMAIIGGALVALTIALGG